MIRQDIGIKLLMQTMDYSEVEINFLNPFSYRSDLGSSNPLSVQVTLGVGLPLAAHLSDTSGPGCRVWSMKRYVSTGDASEK